MSISSAALVKGALIGSALALSALTSRPAGHPSSLAVRASLGEASGRVRPMLGRLSGFEYEPYNSGHLRLTATAARDLRAAMRSLRRHTGRSLSAEAIASLLAGHVDRALRQAERAARLLPESSARWSDLSALHLMIGRDLSRRKHLVLALAAADRAVNLEPDNPVALFNLALALEYLSLRFDARLVWRRYLQVERDHGWRGEGQRRIEALSRPGARLRWERRRQALDRAIADRDRQDLSRLVAADPQQARLHGEEQLLALWAGATSRGEPERAAIALQGASAIGAALADVNQDGLLRNAAAAIQDAAGQGKEHKLAALVDGHLSFARGLGLYRARMCSAAALHFEQARATLAFGGSPIASWASLYLGACRYYSGDFAAALSDFMALLKTLEGQPVPSLRGRVYWSIGLTLAVMGRTAESQAYYFRARELFRRLGEKENTAFLNFLCAENFEDLGQAEQAWSLRYAALSSLGDIVTDRWKHNILLDAGDAALREGQAGAARYFQNALVLLARRQADPATLAEALVRRGRAEFAVGHTAAANRDLDEAAEQAELITELGLRARVEADVLTAQAEICHADDPHVAIGLFSRALMFHRKYAFWPRYVDVLYKRSAVYLALSALPEAEADLQAAIEAIERETAALPFGLERELFFQKASTVYDQMTRLQALGRQRPDLAFEFSERARTHLLRAYTQGGTSEASATSTVVSGIDATRLQLAQGVALIEYAIIEDRVAVWGLSRRAQRFLMLPYDAAAIRSQVQRLLREAQGTGTTGAWQTVLAQLHRMLIDPVEPLLAGAQEVVFVPHDFLETVPFSALYDPVKRLHLIERLPVSLSPSANLYLSLSRTTRLHGVSLGALIFANPAHDRRLFPELSPLKGSKEEALRVASLYSRPRVLVDHDATKAAFLREAGQHEIVHLGTHSILNQRTPALSMLVLAGTGPGMPADVLYEYEIAGQAFARTKLVVLAGCSTAAGRARSRHRVNGMARGFLTAGVPLVLGTLWNVDDKGAAGLLEAFHAGIAAGHRPDHALRAAKIDAIAAAPGSSRAWAPFELFGSAHGYL